MENVLAILIGLGLSAACGFRVFVPLLVMSASASGHLQLAGDFQWLSGTPALIALAVATVLEVLQVGAWVMCRVIAWLVLPGWRPGRELPSRGGAGLVTVPILRRLPRPSRPARSLPPLRAACGVAPGR